LVEEPEGRKNFILYAAKTEHKAMMKTVKNKIKEVIGKVLII
jgi:hypothetical protein